jgi:hypothetical protein
VELSRGTTADAPLQLALGLDDQSAKSASGPQSERAIVDLPSPEQDCVGLTIPISFGGGESRALAVVVEVAPGSDDESHQAALDRCLADVRRSMEAVANRGHDAAVGEGEDWSSIQAAVASLQVPAARRTALVYLASHTGADLCEDVALVADDATLAKLGDQVRSSIGAATPQPAAAVGWSLDSTTFNLLTDMLNAANASGGPPMPDELAAALAAHAGEAGRHPSSMQQVLRQASSRADVDNRLLAENLIFLEDSSPASRVRAYDWLTARGHAPAGYDPLGPPRQRRQALEAGLAAAAAATTAPTNASAAGGAP